MDRKMSEQKLNIEFVKEVENYPCIYDYRRTDYARKEIIDKAWAKIGTKFNLSGPQCRERWKNLRTVLSRNLRPCEGNGKSRASKQQRKPYYLFEAMKFAVPFIKSHNSVPTYFKPRDSSNSPSDKEDKSEDQGENDEDMKEPICHIKIENVDYEPSRSPSPEYAASPPPSPQVNIVEAPSPPTPTPPPPAGPKRARRTLNRTQSHDSIEMEVEEKIPKNFKSKKTKTKKTAKVDLTKISKKRFLLSLLSDVYSMDNIQMRSFRIKVLNIVNEITQTTSTGSLCHQCMGAMPAASSSNPGQPRVYQSPSASRPPPQPYQNNVQEAPPLATVLVKIEKEDTD